MTKWLEKYTQNFSMSLIYKSTILTALMGVVFLIVTSFYCPPNAEDFALSNAPRYQGKLSSIINLLCFFDSRYTANLLHALNPLVWGWYKSFFIIPIFCFAFFLLSVRFLLGSLFYSDKGKGLLWVQATFFTIAYFGVAPSLPYALFYMSSTFTYTYPCVFWMIWTSCLLRGFKSEGILHFLLNTTGLLFLILSFGSSELFILINGISLLLFLVLSLKKNRRRFYTALPYFIIGVVCLVLIYCLPSQKFTSASMYGKLEDRYPEGNFILTSIQQYGKCWIKSIINPFLLLLLLVFALLSTYSKFKEPFIYKRKKSEIIGLLILFQAGTILVTWPYMLARGSVYEEPNYIFNVAIFINLIILLVIAPNLLNHIIDIKNKAYFKSSTFFGISALLPISLFLTTPNYKEIISDLNNGKLQNFRKQQDDFYKNVDSVKNLTAHPWIVYFPQPKLPPKSVWLDGDLLPNRQNEDWNSAYEVYFGIDELRLPGDTIFKN